MRARTVLLPLAGLALALLIPAAGAAQTAGAHDHTGHERGAAPQAAAAGQARLYDNLGTWHRKITTRSPEAQRYFDQGLRLLYAFNLEEAQRSFEQATKLDPRCASCFWGVGMSLGPHINMAALPDRTRAAHAATGKAAALAAKATPVERALIAALGRRYSDPPPADLPAQKALDNAYADAMNEVRKRFPADDDVAALTAEAWMDLRPWGLWTFDGKPRPGTEQIVATLEKILARNPDHPGANHYYIHAVEASPHPERAVPSADRIARLSPGAAHIVHMPSHIYARVGRWGDAAEANRQAIGVDRAYLAQSGPLNFYSMYVAHNYQFLWYVALMSGRGAEALENARATTAQAPVEMMREMPGLDFVLGYPIWTLVALERWDEVLAEPAPPAELAYATGVWHTARGIALARTGRHDEAAKELEQVRAAAGRIPAEATEGVN